MNPDRQPRPLVVERVEWIPSSPDEIEVRVYGAWHGGSVPPPVSLVIGNDVVAPLPDPPASGLAPAWTAAYLVPVDARASLEEGNAALAGPDFAFPLPAAEPGAMDPPPGTVVDPTVLAERRARRAEEGAAARAASAEQMVETLRAQLAHVEERAARAGEARDALAARVADAEGRLRAAEEREEAGRDERAQLEGERGRLAEAEDAVGALERELADARRRAEEAERLAEAEREARGAADEAAARATAEAEALREDADRLRAEADALRSAAPDDALRARAALADDFRAEADSLRAEAESLRAEADALRARAREADQLRAEAEILRSRAAMAEELRARTAELERRLVAEPRGGEVESLRARAAELERRLAAERSARIAAEERLATVADRPPSDHERALIAQVAALESELTRRSAIHERVQEAIALIRVELAQVRAQVKEREPAHAAEASAMSDLRAQLAELEERGRALDAALRARGVELEAARGELDRARSDAAAARAEADRQRQARDAAEHRAAEQERAAAELRERLAEEQAARGRVEAGASAPAAPAAGAEAPPPSTGDPALDTLLAGLREQVAAARRQLAADEPAGEEPAGAEPGAAEPPPATRPADPAGDETRRRLQAIAAELRAAVPEEASASGGGDVIGDLQRAAERLRAAAEQELERLEHPERRPPEPPPPAAPAEAPAAPAPVPAPAAAVEHLGARRGADAAPESDWLRRGLERLAAREPETAAKLLAALLPVQALVADDLAYDLSSPSIGTLRVVLHGGAARVEPRDRPGILGHVDMVLDGPLEALAPLAAGGGGRRLKGVGVSGSRRRLRRLVKARRAPVTLVDLGRAGAPVHPGLLLAALAAAVEPSWTRGHRFAVAYAVGGDGTFTVVADDGAPLRVLPGTPPEAGDLAATVIAAAPAFMPLIAGQAPPEGERAAVVGDRRVVDVLHTWFDTARGVVAG